MTLQGAQAKYQLNTGATPTGVNVGQPSTIGVGLQTVAFADADIAHSFKITSTGVGDVVTLDPSTGALTKTTGTPSVTRWGSQTSDIAGDDFEGLTLTAMVTGYGIVIQPTSIASGTMTLTESSGDNMEGKLDSDSQLPIFGPLVADGNIVFTFSASGIIITVTVIGKSS